MKKYTHYRVGLFIGLLGFNALSSCVNVRRELGIFNTNKVPAVMSLEQQGGLISNQSYNHLSESDAISIRIGPSSIRLGSVTATKVQACGVITSGALLVIAALAGGVWFLSYAANSGMNNDSSVTTGVPLVPIDGNTTTTLSLYHDY